MRNSFNRLLKYPLRKRKAVLWDFDFFRFSYPHSGFSVDAGVCIEAHDGAALERLLRYCARPPFAMD